MADDSTTAARERQALLNYVGHRLDELPIGPAHRKVVLAVGLGLFFEIYEIFLASTIAATLQTTYGVHGAVLEWLLASTFFGMFIGSAVLGRLADRIGRRRAFLLNLTWFSACSLLGALAPTLWLLVAARFLAGVGVGAETPVADSYLSDVLPKSHRGRLTAWAYTCSFIAVPVLGFLSLGLRDGGLFGVAGWRILLVVGSLGAMCVALIRRGLPESPRWLASMGRADEARAAMRAFESGAGRSADGTAVEPCAPPPQPPTDAAEELSPIRRLRVSPYRQRLVMMSVFHVFQTFGYYGFGTLAALVLVGRGYDLTSSLTFTALSFLGYPIGSALAIPMLKWFERKVLIMASAALMALCGMLFATADNAMLIVAFGFLTTATSNVFSNAYHVYQAEIFPTDARATAVGLTYSLSRLSSGVLPLILIPVLNHYGATPMFGVVVVALLVSITAVAVGGPRTSGRSLEAVNPA
ncbi:MAG TPA: MFS transporter [Mycobacterium sp.]|jgi:putative MFS transporter|nr:MFS transporter [Mycobacterium sp.]